MVEGWGFWDGMPMEWMEFLAEIAAQCELTSDQTQAFLARFDRKNSAKSEKQIVAQTRNEEGSEVFAGEAAFKKLMIQVYRKLQKVCPELADLPKGKQSKLEACLQAEFQKRSADVQPSPPWSSGLKPGAPYPRLRLPDNYVDRPQAVTDIKSLLLAENSTVVVSAIAGLGGLGKSVLATALVLDEEVRSRFEDGILWETLGQNPDLLSLVGDWIRALDESRESYAATTLESASRYLETLLAEKRVLLVVDDVWNAEDVKHFRVGGVGDNAGGGDWRGRLLSAGFDDGGRGDRSGAEQAGASGAGGGIKGVCESGGVALRIYVRTFFEGSIHTLTKAIKFSPSLPHPIL
jgi:NB-ARC domain